MNIFKFSKEKEVNRKQKIFTFLIICRSMVVVVGAANVSLVTHYARIAGVSPSVCLSVTILTSFISALMFYLIYNEVLNARHWIGLISIMLGVFVIGLSKSSTSSSEGSIINSQGLENES